MKLHIGVFFGGKATEHEVSVISAIQAIENMDKNKYHIVPIYITKDEHFLTGDQLLDIEKYKDLGTLIQKATEVSFEKTEDNKVNLLRSPAKRFTKRYDYIDLIFPVLHGYKGENGSIQGFFEMLGLPYVGSNVLASAIGMDKDIAKIVAKSIQVPVIDFEAVTKYEFFNRGPEIIEHIIDKLHFPMIVKPASGGSSIGIEVAKDEDQLKMAIEQVFCFDVKIIIENKVESIREVNCSVLGDISEARASVIEEPSTAEDILSFEDKYMNNSTKGMSSASRQIPADLSDSMTKRVKDYSIRLFKKIGCSGVVRIDYIIDTRSNSVYFNEINTIPGSLSFYLWKEEENMTYTKQLDEMIKVAIKTHQRMSEFNYAFDNNLFTSNGLNMKGKLKG